MKKLLLSLTLVALAAAGASAQEENFGTQRKGKHEHGMALEKLNLTDKQKADIEKINVDFKNRMVNLKKEDDISVKEWNSRKETLRKQRRTEIQAVLTNEQKEQLKKMHQEGRAKQKHSSEERLEMMKDKLGLSNEQTAKIKELQSGFHNKIKSIRENESLAAADKKEQIRQVLKENHKKIESVLTEDQIEKLKELKQNRQGKKKVVG